MEVRHLTQEDREALAGFYRGLSERSRALRFGTPLPRWPAGWLERVTAVDGHEHEALGGFVQGRLVGVLHRVSLGPAAAEVAVAVADAWQGQGVGSRLLDAALADDRGWERLVFSLSGENRAMARMLARRGARIRYSGGWGEAVLDVAA